MVWEVALVVLLLVLTVLVILLIPTVVSFYRTLGKLSKTLDELNRELPEILQNIGDITDQTSRASRTLNSVVDNIAEFEHFSARRYRYFLDCSQRYCYKKESFPGRIGCWGFISCRAHVYFGDFPGQVERPDDRPVSIQCNLWNINGLYLQLFIQRNGN